MKRLIEYTVFSGLVTAWRLATWPTRRSPVLVIATTEGVVREPSWLGITTGSPPCITATTEFVVPRSIPIILLIATVLIEFFPNSCETTRPLHRFRAVTKLHNAWPLKGSSTLPKNSVSLQVECDCVKLFDSNCKMLPFFHLPPPLHPSFLLHRQPSFSTPHLTPHASPSSSSLAKNTLLSPIHCADAHLPRQAGPVRARNM